MKFWQRLFVVFVAALAVGLSQGLAARALAVDPPDPDVTGHWTGVFVTVGDPFHVREASLQVARQDRHRFSGELSLDLLRFGLNGTVACDPPDPDCQFRATGGTQQRRDAMRIVIRGSLTPADDRSPQAIVADFMIVGADGRPEIGTLYLMPIGSR